MNPNNNEDVHDKIQRLKELKANPLADMRAIGKLRDELAMVDMTSLSTEEKHVLFD